MAALRRRKSSPAGLSSPSVVPVPGKAAPSSPVSNEEWITPKKVARRPVNRGVVGVGTSSPSSLSPPNQVPSSPVPVFHPAGTACRSSSGVPVGAGVGVQEAGFVPKLNSGLRKGVLGNSGSQSPSAVDKAAACRFGGPVPGSETFESQPAETETLVSVPVLDEDLGSLSNPFAQVGSNKWAGRPKSRGDAYLGPSKRARPVEPPSQRVASKGSRAKGKGPLKGLGSESDPFTFSASSASPRGTDGPVGLRSQKSRRRDGLALGSALGSSQSMQVVGSSHEEAVALVKEAIQGASSAEPMVSSLGVEGSGLGPRHPSMDSDSLVVQGIGDSGEAPPSSHSE